VSAASLGSPEDDVEGAGERVRLLLRSRPQGHDPPFLAMAEEEGKRRSCAVIALFIMAPSPQLLPRSRFAGDSPLEERVSCELVL
jgi:hypothetical protein